MANSFTALPLARLESVPHLLRPEHQQSPPDLYSPAVLVMTDFLTTSPVSIEQSCQVDHALAFMKRQQVRLLFAIDEKSALCGIITARDLTGDGVIRCIQQSGISRDQLTVRELMLPVLDSRVIDYADVERASIGQVMSTLTQASSQHLLVVDQGLAGVQRIRGIISASNISRTLNQDFAVIAESGSFAGLESALHSGKSVSRVTSTL